MKILIFKSLDPNWVQYAVIIPDKTTIWYKYIVEARQAAQQAVNRLSMIVKDVSGEK